jgi:hypothetical protein
MSGTYDGYAVPGLWRMVANENPANNAAHENAWNDKLTLLNAQLESLRALREQGVGCWNPDRSAAAAAFVGQIDRIIVDMTRAGEAAATVKLTYTAVSEALIGAKSRLESLREVYFDPKAALRTYLKTSTPLAPLLNGLPDDRVPTVGFPDSFGAAVLESHQRRLDAQARAILEQADQEVEAATATSATVPPMARLDDGAAPPIPTRQLSGGGVDSSSASGRYLPPPVFDPPAPDGRPDIDPSPRDLDPGPFLTGTPPPVSPSVLTAPPATATVAPVLPSPPAGGWLIQTPSGQRALRPGGLIEGPAYPALGRRSAVETGPGVIGGQPGPAVNRSGVIGQEPGAGRTANRPKSTRRASTTSRPDRLDERAHAGGWRDRSYEAYARRRPDPELEKDEHWYVEEGVRPLLEAPEAPSSHDATPGVIGLDR